VALAALASGCATHRDAPIAAAGHGSTPTAGSLAATDPPTTASPSRVSAGRPSGIIFLALQDQDWIVESVDPGNGRATQAAEFLPTDDSVTLDSDYERFNGGGPLADRALFSPDLTRAVATKTMADGTRDVGWIDRAGTFTDVTAGAPKATGFSSTTSDDTPAFGPDGAFYFARRVPDGSVWATNPAIWRLTGQDPATAGQVTTLDQVNYYVNAPSRIMPLCAGCVPFRSPAGQDRGAFRATDFLGTTAYLSTDDNGSMVYRSPIQAEADTSLTDWGTGGTALIPQTNRTVWSPVASPDGTQVAFLSKAVDQSDPTIAPQLYVVSAQGGAPRLVTAGSGDLNGRNPTLLGWF
jgi:hypothetical protein